jgi:hypothetical protein
MPTSNPIDQLIHDLEQERATKYRERVKRFRAREAQLKKASEAHEKKQLDFMRSAGLKLNQIEQDQKDEAGKLKSYLEQTRTPLISRPSMSVEDAKQAAQSIARLGGLGLAIPPSAGFYYPPDTSGEVLPVEPSRIKIKDEMHGHGWGWQAIAQQPVPPADVAFYFIPEQSARYSLTVSFAFHGFYVLKADDGWLTSKDAQVTLDFSLDTVQFVDRGPKPFPLIDLEGQNIDEFDNFDNVLSFGDTQDLRQGEPVVVIGSIAVSAGASGAGSYAEVNFADGDANYIEPQYLWVTNLTGFGQ